MREVQLDPAGEYRLTDRGRRDILINVNAYWEALEACRATIQQYNKTVGGAR